MSSPAPNLEKLLGHWMEWEAGDATPGTVLKNLKVAGLRQILEGLANPEAEN